MGYNYKDLTYIRVALQVYEGKLTELNEGDCPEDEFSEVQEDIQYLSRLLALTERLIDEAENNGPTLNPVR